MDTLSIVGIATGTVSLLSCGLLAHHESTVRILHCGARPKSADAAVPADQREGTCARLAMHAVLATQQTVAILSVAILHISLLLLCSTLVYSATAGAEPLTNAQIDASIVIATLAAAAVLCFDLAYDLGEWCNYAADAADAFFGAGPRGRRERAELAAERVNATPLSWMVCTAVHVAYAATVPLQQTAPPEILRGGAAGNTEEGMATSAATVVLACVTGAAFLFIAAARLVAIYTVNRWLASSDVAAAASEEACFAVHWQYTAQVTVDAIVRVAALLDAAITALILAVRPYKQDISRVENWQHLYIGLVVCLPVATVLVAIVYSLNCPRHAAAAAASAAPRPPAKP